MKEDTKFTLEKLEALKELNDKFPMEKSTAAEILKGFSELNFDAKKIGQFDKQGRFWLNEEFKTLTSANIRTPSAAWPYSVYKHVQSKKYKKSLIEKAEFVLNGEKIKSLIEQKELVKLVDFQIPEKKTVVL